jgi:hypothetical protein
MNGSALRFALLLALTTLAASCGGTSAPSAGPSAVPSIIAPPLPPPAPVPAPALQPQFPDVLGRWSGTTTIVVTVDGQQQSSACTETWRITSQNAGAFSGTFQTSGMAGDCERVGMVNVVMTPNGGVTELFHSAQIGTDTRCTKTNATPYAGRISDDGLTFTAMATDSLLCGSGSAATNARRRIAVLMTKN